MKTVYFPAMNCHLASILNIVSTLTKDFRFCYATLWSEFDLNFDAQYDIYISKRIFKNFEYLGNQIENLDCSTPQTIKQIVDSFESEKYFFVGMDTYFIPWDGAFQGFHEHHYFVAQKQKDNLLCFDPVYGKSNLPLDFEQLFNHAFALGVVQKVANIVVPPATFFVKQQAEEVLENHPRLLETLVGQVNENLSQPKMLLNLSKKTTAMLCNRWQFADFFQFEVLALLEEKQLKNLKDFFNQDYFSQWATVKNGLTMLSIRPSQKLADDVISSLNSVFALEQQMADTLLTLLV